MVSFFASSFVLLLSFKFMCQCFLLASYNSRRTTHGSCSQQSRRSSNTIYSLSSKQSSEFPNSAPPLVIHHSALKTRNITTAIQFYSMLGYTVACRFRTGPARATWLESESSASRLEIIEVPQYLLNEQPGTRKRALDLMQRQDLLGYNHVALDVTEQIQSHKLANLSDWMEALNATSEERFGRTVRVALEPRQQIIGKGVYELAFLYDADGCLVELLHKQSELAQDIQSGWEPWDGEGFVGEQKEPPAG